MMSRAASSIQIDAAAVLHARGKGDWLKIADELAEMPQADFDMILLAFQSYRHARQIDRQQEARLYRSPPQPQSIPQKKHRSSRAA